MVFLSYENSEGLDITKTRLFKYIENFTSKKKKGGGEIQ